MLSPAAMRASKAATRAESSAVTVGVCSMRCNVREKTGVRQSCAHTILPCMHNDAPSSSVPDGKVSVHIADGIGTVEFFHPKGNSLPGSLLRQLAAEITTLGENPEVRVIVLRSGGTGPFCAGASFDEFSTI